MEVIPKSLLENLGPSALLALFILGILFGRLIPRATANREQDLLIRQQELLETKNAILESALEIARSTHQTSMRQMDELIRAIPEAIKLIKDDGPKELMP